ncbi:MAG: nitroreductase [Planctomyces sp.]|nr:nitroreductase [Planctomyces sp.]
MPAPEIRPENLLDTRPETDAAVILRIISNRRSIKPGDYLETPIPPAILDQLFEAANWAPTHGMTEPWRFVVFEGDTRIALGEELARIYRSTTSADQIQDAKAEKLCRNPSLSPCILAIGMHRQVSKKIPEIEEIEAVACAVQNLHLMATALGIGGYWSSGAPICTNEFRDFLGMSPDDKVLGLFYLGYPSKPWPTGTRTPNSEKVTWYNNNPSAATSP